MDDSRVPPLFDSEESEPLDRLSELPNLLIFEILSLLEMRDVVRTTILSKRWKDLWTTVSCLYFWGSDQSFISAALAKWKGTDIFKFSIGFFEDDPPTGDILDSWLLLPIKKQVEELYVYMGSRMDPEYCTPQPLYSCSSLTKLSLSYCEVIIGENVQWNRLKSLTMEGINYLNQHTMNQILSGAPLLEELMLLSLQINENLNIQSSSLKILHIGRHDRFFRGDDVHAMLKIRAPNLFTLEISAFFYDNNCLLDVPSLGNAILHFQTLESRRVFGEHFAFEMFNHVFRSICHAVKVTLSVWCSEFLVYLKKKDMVVPFSNAKFLKLHLSKADEMLDVLEMFPNLVMLIIDKDHEYKESVRKMPLLTPCLLQLKTIEITWFVDDAIIIQIVEILLKNARMLEKMVLRLCTYSANQETFTLAVEKVLSVPRSSPNAEVIIIKDFD